MIPVKPEPRQEFLSTVIEKYHEGYTSLPANEREPYTETKWRLSWRERLQVLFGGHIYLIIKNFGDPLHPVRLCTKRDYLLAWCCRFYGWGGFKRELLAVPSRLLCGTYQITESEPDSHHPKFRDSSQDYQCSCGFITSSSEEIWKHERESSGLGEQSES